MNSTLKHRQEQIPCWGGSMAQEGAAATPSPQAAASPPAAKPRGERCPLATHLPPPPSLEKLSSCALPRVFFPSQVPHIWRALSLVIKSRTRGHGSCICSQRCSCPCAWSEPSQATGSKTLLAGLLLPGWTGFRSWGCN